MKSLIQFIQEAKIDNDFVNVLKELKELVNDDKKNINHREFDKFHTSLMFALSNFKTKWKERLNKTDKPFIITHTDYHYNIDELEFILPKDDEYLYLALRKGESYGWHIYKNQSYYKIPKNRHYFVLTNDYKELFKDLISQ